MKRPIQFLTNEKGERTAVIIGIEDYEQLLEEIEDLQAAREYRQAKASGGVPIPFDQAIARIEKKRK